MVPKDLWRSDHRRDWKLTPLSEVQTEGTPKWETQPAKKASQQDLAVALTMGTASTKRLVLSIIVSK